MEKAKYMKPVAKIYNPKFRLLDTMPVGSSPNDKPIESREPGFFEEEDQGSWHNLWEK